MAGRGPQSRKKVLKIGQPRDEELKSLAHDIVSAWRPLGMMLGLTDMTLIEIDKANRKVSDKVYAVLRKWKESLGSGASYEALADGLDNAFIKRHELVKRYCHGKGTSSAVASSCCLVELLLAIFWAVFTGFSCFLGVAGKRETGREEVFKIGQPEDKELRNLAHDFVIDIKTLCEMLDLKDLPLNRIYRNRREEHQIYTVLAKWKGSRESVKCYETYNPKDLRCTRSETYEPTDLLLLPSAEWKELLEPGAIASYQTLALLLDDRRIERHDLVERYCHDYETGREEVFKIGQPDDTELLSLAHEIESIWRSFGLLVGIEAPTLTEIDEGYSRDSDKTYAVLRKWKESLGSGASYQALALLLDTAFINRHVFEETCCHDKETGREEVFKTGQPKDKELRSLAHDIVSFWRTPCFVFRRKIQTLVEISRFHSIELDNTFDKLIKWMEASGSEWWMEASGSEKSYQELAEFLKTKIKNVKDLEKRYCHDKAKTGEKEVFKKGQPKEEELFILAQDMMSTWRSLGVVLNRTTQTLSEIDKSNLEEENKPYVALKEWKEAVKSRASYQALAWVLNTAFVNRRDLVEKYCRGKGIYEVFKIGQPRDKELRSLAQELTFDWISLGRMLGLSDVTLIEVDKAYREEEDKIYTVLTKWKQLKSEASYQALALLLDDGFIERHDLIERFCHNKEIGREEVFKIDQPEDLELASLASDIASTWKSYRSFTCPETRSSSAIDKSQPQVMFKTYFMLRNWKRSSGSGANYRALARVLNTTYINVHDLVKKHCHDKEKVIEKVFKTGQPEDKELRSLAHDLASTWRSLGVVLGLKAPTLTEIGAAYPQASYAMLTKWKESLGSRATYVALADGLDNAFIKRHDLVKRYCHDIAVEMRLNRRR